MELQGLLKADRCIFSFIVFNLIDVGKVVLKRVPRLLVLVVLVSKLLLALQDARKALSLQFEPDQDKLTRQENFLWFKKIDVKYFMPTDDQGTCPPVAKQEPGQQLPQCQNHELQAILQQACVWRLSILALYDVVLKLGLLGSVYFYSRPFVYYAIISPFARLFLLTYLTVGCSNPHLGLPDVTQVDQATAVYWASWKYLLHMYLKLYPVMDNWSDFSTGDKYTRRWVRDRKTRYSWLYLANFIFHLWLVQHGGKRKEEEEAVQKMQPPLRKNKKKEAGKKGVRTDWFLHACLYGHKDQVKTLLKDPSIDVNQRCAVYDYTGLHLACLKDRISVVQLLLDNKQHQADLLAVDANGKTSLQIAVSLGHHSIVLRYLKCRRFSWKRFSRDQLLLEAINHDQFGLAIKLVGETCKRQPIKDPNVSNFLERCLKLNKGLEDKKLPECHQASRIKSLVIYKECLANIFTGADTSAQQPKTPSSAAASAKTIDARDRMLELRGLFECPVCAEEMLAGTKIYACTNDHWICSQCLEDPRITACPTCRQDFKGNAPKRCLTGEKIALQL